MCNLSCLKDELELISKFDVELYEVIEIIDKIQKSNMNDIYEWREHLLTNYSMSQLDHLTLELINRYK